MITKLQLTNWCCFSDFTIEFDPQVTVILGDNGKGKSAIQRALLWVAFNQWDGPADAFIKHGEDFAHVTLWTTKHQIERLKGKRDGKPVNLYRVDGADYKFDSVNRRTVPDAIASKLNLGADNFQVQRDPGYWFALSAGDCAKALNRIVNLEAIDQSLMSVATLRREAKAEESVCRTRLESWRDMASALDWVDTAQADLCTLEQVETDIALKHARIDGIERSTQEAGVIASLEKNAAQLILAGKKAIAAYQQAGTAQGGLSSLCGTIEALQNIQRRHKTAEQELGRQQASLKQYLAQGCPLCGK